MLGLQYNWGMVVKSGRFDCILCYAIC